MSQKKIKILLFAEFGETGGTRTYLKQLIELYAQKDVELALVVPGHKVDIEISALLEKFNFSVVTPGQLHEDLNFQVGGLLRRILCERRIFSRLVKNFNPNLIVCSVGTIDLFLGAASCHSRSLYIMHTYPEIASNFFRRWYRKVIYSLIFCKKINLLTVSDFARVKIRDVFGLWFGGCIDRIYNSSVLPGMKNIFNTTSSGEVNVLTVGHVEDYKNPFLWVDVAKIVMQNSPADCVIRFLWVGEGSLLEECRIKVDALGLTSRIKFAGPSSSVAEFYEAADIYFQPSRMESFGIAVLDAMQYGLPTVVSSVGGLPELVSSGMNGYLLAEDDICGYADAILSLAVDRDKRNNFGASAKYKYLTKFNYERWQRETWVVHEKILKKQRKAHESTEKN